MVEESGNCLDTKYDVEDYVVPCYNHRKLLET